MSRPVRRKNPTTPVKASKRRGSDSSSSLDLSDDDGYSAVEDISDSEDDDEDDVNAAEEENILTEGDHKPPPSPRSESNIGEDEDNENDGDAEADAYESTSWAGIASDVEEHQVSDFYQEASFGSDNAVERHVRFDLPSSESDSTETEDDYGDLFPDIFVSQNSLDPAFRREIEDDPDESSGSASFWDLNSYSDQEQADSDAEEVVRELDDDVTPTATPRASHHAADVQSTPVAAYDEPQDLDGYETDGDTTEEDIPEPPPRRKSRRPSVPMSEMSDSDGEPVKSQRGQPRVGRFNLDRSEKKPIAVLNPLTRKMMIFTPHRRRQLDLSPEQFNLQWQAEEQSSPLLSHSANLMFSAMFSSNTFGDFVNTQAMGPTEAFFPFPSEGNTVEDSSSPPSWFEEDGDDAEKKLDLNDLIAWGDDPSGDEQGGEGRQWDSALPPTASSDNDVLSHLNSETVGAFRRNQINQQLILSNQATQDSLAFSGPYNFTAIKGLKSDRFDTAGMPLTPMRRHKKQMSDMARSPLESMSAKRKASGEASTNGHKRHRSISDVNSLRI